jgi:GntR family transcriptional regulator
VALGLDDGEEVLVLEKLFLEDSTPVVLARNRIPATLVPDGPRLGIDLPVYEYLEKHCNRRLSYYLSEIVPVAFDADQAGKLGVAMGTVGLSFVEVGFDQNNEPVVHATSYFRDDLLRFRMIRRTTGA